MKLFIPSKATLTLNNDSIWGGDDSLFDGDDSRIPSDLESIFGGESELSDERPVPPPARSSLKRSIVLSDSDAGETSACKKQKLISLEGHSEDDSVIEIEDSDDELASPGGSSSNDPGPSTPHQQPPKPRIQRISKVQKRAADEADVAWWGRTMERLLEVRKTMDHTVSKNQASHDLECALIPTFRNSISKC